MFEIEFNGETSKLHGIKIQTRPAIPAPVRNIETIDIPGRDEPMYRTGDVSYNDITITVSMGFYAQRDSWAHMARNVKQWLSGEGKLKFSDDPEIFYQVKNIDLDDIERSLRKIGTFEANFRCSPFCYIEEGTWGKTVEEVRFNPYMTCHPIYRITGNGSCTLTVNGNTMTADVGQNLTIDTDRMIACRLDGTLQNTAVAGDYEGLYLIHGDNTINLTSGFGLTVIPRWRCL